MHLSRYLRFLVGYAFIRILSYAILNPRPYLGWHALFDAAVLSIAFGFIVLSEWFSDRKEG